MPNDAWKQQKKKKNEWTIYWLYWVICDYKVIESACEALQVVQMCKMWSV